MKAIWLSALQKQDSAVQKIMARMKPYGLAVLGHFWQNENAKLAWLGALDDLADNSCDMWAVLGAREDFENTELRYGLSLMAIGLQARYGPGFPMVVLQTDTPLVDAAALPTPLAGAAVIEADSTGAPAKLVAKAHAAPAAKSSAYFINMVGDSQLGQWFEIRPANDTWPGVIFGVDQGEIRFQAVGPPGKLPGRTTLNYPMQGLKLQLNEKEYTAWALRNEISPDASYYVKIEGAPGSVLFGAFTEEEQTELFTLELA